MDLNPAAADEALRPRPKAEVQEQLDTQEEPAVAVVATPGADSEDNGERRFDWLKVLHTITFFTD